MESNIGTCFRRRGDWEPTFGLRSKSNQKCPLSETTAFSPTPLSFGGTFLCAKDTRRETPAISFG